MGILISDGHGAPRPKLRTPAFFRFALRLSNVTVRGALDKSLALYPTFDEVG